LTVGIAPLHRRGGTPRDFAVARCLQLTAWGASPDDVTTFRRWRRTMKAFVIALLLLAAPIYMGEMFLDDSSTLGFGAFSGATASRYQSQAQDLAHNAIDQARNYAMAHPELIEGIKSHQADLQDLKSKLCSALKC
jgi:hypothetical protein